MFVLQDIFMFLKCASFHFQLSRPPVGGKPELDPGRAEERKLFVGMLR
jgi:hypothetical protein